VISQTWKVLAALCLVALVPQVTCAQQISPDTAEPGSVEEIARDTTETIRP
jgi:hypothetical protein